MKLTTEKILEYYEAFTRIDGYARAVEANGRTSIVVESYDLSPKVKWRCVVNKTLLRPIRDAAEAERTAKQKALNDFMASMDPKMEPAEAAKLIRDTENKSNAELAEMMKNETDIPGLMKLPGVGIRIRGRDPGIIGVLTSIANDFIDGEPDYGQDRKSDKEKDE